MTSFLRVNVEFGNTPTGEGDGLVEAVIIRQSAEETILASSLEGDAQDGVALTRAVLSRMIAEVQQKVGEQLEHAARVLREAG